MQTRYFKILAIVASATFGLNAVAANISHVSVRQRWPWSRLVDIDYVIADATQAVDITVNAFNGDQPLVLDKGLSGDLYCVSGQGARRIIWDPTQSQYANEEVLSRFRVTLTTTPAPLYIIVNLMADAGADGQIEHIYPGDARLETYGRFTNVWFGVTNDSVYASDKLVLRRIPAGSFTMGGQGYTEYAMTLTKDMFVGVFQVTQKQWNHVMNTTGGTDTQAKHSVTYDTIRGATNSTPAIDWPTTGRAVAPGSFLGKLREKTGITGFDLPTEAQWEYFCRARTTTVYNDGNTGVYYTGNILNNNGKTNEYLNALGWYTYSAPTPPTGPVPVGSKRPNAWGLYDTHGNVWEWCLDWYGTPVSGYDPTGVVSGSKRLKRGGAYNSNADICRSAFRVSDGTPSYASQSTGFRLVLILP